MDWIDKVANQVMSLTREEYFGHAHYHEDHTGIYKPVRDSYDRLVYIADLASFYHRIREKAPFLTEMIIDDDIPAEMDVIGGGFWGFGGGRIEAIKDVGSIIYYPAMDNLREAMLHDRNKKIRLESVRSLRRCGEKSIKYVPDLCRTMLNDEYFMARYEAAEALCAVGDERAVKPLREAIEFAFYVLKAFSHESIYGEDSAPFLYIFESALTALFKLDENMATEVLKKGLSHCNPHVRHHSKRSAIHSKKRDLANSLQQIII